MKDEDRARVGRFSIPDRVMDNSLAEDIRQIMGKCVITRAEHVYYAGRIEYEAFSPHFDIVPEGVMAPTYEWVFSGGGWTPRRTDTYSINDVQKMISAAVKAVPTKVIIKQRERGWRRCQ